MREKAPLWIYLLGILVLIATATRWARGEDMRVVYVNTGNITVAEGDKDEVAVPITVPAGATAILGWRMGAEMAPGTVARVVAWFHETLAAEALDHFATRVAAQQAEFVKPPVRCAVVPGQVLTLRVRVFNEGVGPQTARANIRVWFLVP